MPDRSSKVGAKAAGRLARVLVQEGAVVQAGEVLVELPAAALHPLAALERALGAGA